MLYPLLADTAEKLKPASYLEIGVRDGASLATVVMAAGPQLRWLTLCDTWDDSYGGTGRASHQHVECLLDALNFQGENVRYLDGDSARLIPMIAGEGHRFDLITVDGAHSIESAATDLTNCWPLLTERGVLVMDDVSSEHHPELGPLFEEFARAKRAKILSYIRLGVGAGALTHG